MSGFEANRPLDPLRWLGVPFIVCIVATIILGLPLRVMGISLPEPVFAFVPAFAWAVIRPAILPPILLVVLGLFLDLFWYAPMGFWSISLLLVYGFVLMTRPAMAGQSTAVMWLWFTAACGLAGGMGYLLTMLDALSNPNPIALFFQFVVSIALYPLAHRLIQQFEDADVRFR